MSSEKKNIIAFHLKYAKARNSDIVSLKPATSSMPSDEIQANFNTN